MPTHRTRGRSARVRIGSAPAGFSLVEMIAVIAIISIILALLAPAIGAFSSGAGRKGAVNVLMNTFEQARAAALETGSNVDVILWRRTFPEPDALMVVREKNEFIDGAGGGIVPLSKWIKLPRGVLLKTIPRSLAASDSALPPAVTASDLPGESNKERLSGLRFNPSGAITFPAGDLRLFVSDGVRDASGSEAQVGATAQSTRLEQISFAKFTGRVQLDVTTID